MFRKLLYLLNLVNPSQIDTKKFNNKDTTSKNPYMLVWYRSDWSERMIQKKTMNLLVYSLFLLNL